MGVHLAENMAAVIDTMSSGDRIQQAGVGQMRFPFAKTKYLHKYQRNEQRKHLTEQVNLGNSLLLTSQLQPTLTMSK